MKKSWIIGTLAFTLGIGLGIATPLPQHRFEKITDERGFVDDDNFIIIRDRETGQEIVCYGRYGGLVSGSYAMSCWPTGRKW